MSKIKLVMGCDDSKFKVLLSRDDYEEVDNSTKIRANFWEDVLYLPINVTYNTPEDAKSAKD